jgi:hypothetical protein
MFTFSGIQINPTVRIPGGGTGIGQNTRGAQYQLEIHHWITVPIDLDVDCNCSPGLLTFASGATCNKPASGIPKCTKHQGTIPLPPGFFINEPISKVATALTGSELVSSYRVRYRYSHAAGWNPYHYPSGGHTVTVNVS